MENKSIGEAHDPGQVVVVQIQSNFRFGRGLIPARFDSKSVRVAATGEKRDFRLGLVRGRGTGDGTATGEVILGGEGTTILGKGKAASHTTSPTKCPISMLLLPMLRL